MTDTLDQLADLGIQLTGGPTMTDRTSTPPAPRRHHHQSFAARDACESCTTAMASARAALRAESVAAPQAVEAEVQRLEQLRAEVRRTGDGDATRWRMLGLLDDTIASLRAALAAAPPALDAARLAEAMRHHEEQRRRLSPGAYPHLGQDNDIRRFADWLAVDYEWMAATPASGEPAAPRLDVLGECPHGYFGGYNCPECGDRPTAGAESPR